MLNSPEYDKYVSEFYIIQFTYALGDVVLSIHIRNSLKICFYKLFLIMVIQKVNVKVF